MKWRCALIQKWLPAYPDGDLPSFWRGRIEAHLERCPACREELAGLEEVVRRVKAVPEPDPGEAFWQTFNQELHLKLAQSTPAPAPSRFAKIPYYLLGAPAVALLVFWIGGSYLHQERPGVAPVPKVAHQEKAPAQLEPEKKMAAPRLPKPPPAATTGAVVLATQNGYEMPPDDDVDLLLGDLDSTLAGMTEKQKEDFLKKLRRHDKDGSCLRKYAAVFWA